MTTVIERAIPVQDFSGIVGQHIIYTYANGWIYEVYVKNESTIDYRVHGGDVAGRWVKDQPVELARVATSMFTVSWTEPTGNTVSLLINMAERWLHCATWFAKWVHDNPKLTVMFQNDHLDEIRALRDKGPVSPQFMLHEFATITFAENSGIDNEDVIDCAPGDLPKGYITRTN
ncbi:phenolic acid decarboxylase [Nocardia altamirensis]|uniref:phenolic acid decarboxylase n=1 Tax=Nocardia altamirensis TaxID=472158 RepID=UPI000840128D|nr:phenolic acid decarboxylase [Nocardia altamirensis]